MAAVDESFDLVEGEHVFAEYVFVDFDRDAGAWVFLHVFMLDGIADDLFETLEAASGTFAFGVLLKVFGEGQNHVAVDLLGADDLGVDFVFRRFGKEGFEAFHCHLDHLLVFLGVLVVVLLEVIEEVDFLGFLGFPDFVRIGF